MPIEREVIHRFLEPYRAADGARYDVSVVGQVGALDRARRS
jgi:hypothetical protein